MLKSVLNLLFNLPYWVFFCLLTVWFITLLVAEFLFIPRKVRKKAKDYYVNSTSYPNAQKNIEEHFKNSSFEEIYSSFLRAFTKKCMYILLLVIAVASMIHTLYTKNDFDHVVFFSACIALLEAIDSHYLMKEKDKLFKNLNADMSKYSLNQESIEANLIATEEEERYNSLTPFEQLLEKLSERPIKRTSTISINGKKKKYNVNIKKDKNGEADVIELDFDKSVKYVDKRYRLETAEYRFDDKNTFIINKENNGQKYTITINLRPINIIKDA